MEKFIISFFGIIKISTLFHKITGKGFVAQYYALFDDPNSRNSLVNMYNVSLNAVILSNSIVLKLFANLLEVAQNFENKHPATNVKFFLFFRMSSRL